MNIVDKEIEQYCIEKSNRPSSDCDKIETYTRANVHGAQMLIGKMEASILGFLLRSINAKRVLELGTFTGYSALAMAENLPIDGEIITVDVNDKTVSLAKEFWGSSKHGYKIKSMLGEGLKIVPELEGKFDLVFIDADKRNYLPYLEMLLPRLTHQGVIVIDNVLWSGRVLESAKVDPEEEHRNSKFIRELNNWIAKNNDLYGTLLPVRDGMFLIKKI
jgi:caffeoyl-CoA O-methyltransferase